MAAQWHLSGDYFENCNCSVVCPCVVSKAPPLTSRPTEGVCDVGVISALEIEVFLTDANKDLVEAGIDVALRTGELADSSLTARKIAQSQRRVVGAPAYFATMGVP